jgi:signal recognition particle subunit SRP54
MIPGLPKEVRNAEISDDMIVPVEAMIRSMTPDERRDPGMINGSRRNRIARGSGTTTTEVNRLLDQFRQMQRQMRQMMGLPGVGRRVDRRSKSSKKAAKKKRRGRS